MFLLLITINLKMPQLIPFYFIHLISSYLILMLIVLMIFSYFILPQWLLISVSRLNLI
jgi:Fungal ATP synthase protein 8 (A6L)